MRQDDKALCEAMVQEAKDRFGEAMEKSGKPLIVDPFFMALLFAQHKVIRSLLAELNARGVAIPEEVAISSRSFQTKLS